MSRFEYYLAFETILYGLILAHLVVGFSKMIYHRKTIDFYWGHLLGCLIGFFVVVQTYYALFWVPAETVIGPWSFFFLRILPLSLLYIMVYQIVPEKVKGMKSEEFLFKRLKEILLPMVLFNILAVFKTIYYRWDEYLELGGGVIYGSSKFWLFVSPSLALSAIALLLIFRFNQKRIIEAFIVFTFIMTMGLMFFTPTH